MANHALLSASSSHRWLNCPPSARLCEGYDDKGSDFAAEGTDAHALCEYKLRKALGMEANDPTEDLTWYNSEMEECANGYVSFVMELVEEAKKTCPDPVVLIEQRLDYSKYVEEGFGTGDCVIIADGTLHIVDYMELAKFEFRQPPLLTDEEVEEILGRIDELIAWASDIKDYALQAAISGKQWSGYKLVEGRSNRKYTDENAVIAAVTAAGYDPYEHKILGVTAMTALLGKKQFNDILGGLITKPQGKPTLVPDSDKRPAMTTIIDDFKEDN